MSPYHERYQSGGNEQNPQNYDIARQWARHFLYGNTQRNIEQSMTDLGALCYLIGKGLSPQEAYAQLEDWQRYDKLSKPFRIVGYYQEYSTIPIEDSIQFGKLTHIMWSFLLPKADGSVKPLNNTKKLKEVIAIAKKYGVKVYLVVGGFYDGDIKLDKVFEDAMSNADSANRLVDSIMQYVYDYDFDGVDIDWEYPKEGQPSQQGFQDLMIMLRKRLKPLNKGLSTAVIGGVDPKTGSVYKETVNGYTDKALQQADFINLMTYDGGDGEEHSSIDFANYSLDYWMTRVPKDKLTVGIAAYSRPDFWTYRRIIEANPANAYQNNVTIDGRLNYYNDIPETRTKTKIAIQRGNGVLFWEINFDTTDGTSLVNAAYEVAKQNGKI